MFIGNYAIHGNIGVNVQPVYAVIRLEIGGIAHLIIGVNYGKYAVDHLQCSGYGLQGLVGRIVTVNPLGKDRTGYQ